jgi:chemotaxis protein MotB
MTTKPPIIIIKKKGGHGGHHGGAWKVAYADFVTAMMALFIVLWLLNSSKKIQEAVGGYFRDPQGTAEKAGKSVVGSNATSIVPPADNMQQLKQQLEKAIAGIPNFDKLKSHIEMTITPEGLRIELIESASGTFFDSGSPKLSGDGQDLLKALAVELGKLPNKISVEGHTDAKPYALGAVYTNWELSADRANAARRLVQENGVGEDQITQVRGYAAMQLRKPDAPLDPSNRRVSLIVHYQNAANPNPEDAAAAANAAAAAGADATPAPTKPDRPPPLSPPTSQPPASK